MDCISPRSAFLFFLTGLQENDMSIIERAVIDMGNIIVRSGNLYHSPTWA